jgi:hypothetical protein
MIILFAVVVVVGMATLAQVLHVLYRHRRLQRKPGDNACPIQGAGVPLSRHGPLSFTQNARPAGLRCDPAGIDTRSRPF